MTPSLPPGFENYQPIDTSQLLVSSNGLPKGFEKYQPLQPFLDTSQAGKIKINPVRGSTKGLLEAAPEAAADALPIVGSFAGPEGTGLGSSVKMLLKSSFPKIFGEGPKEPEDIASGLASDYLANEAVPRSVQAMKDLAMSPKESIGKVLGSFPLKGTRQVSGAVNLDRADQFANMATQGGKGIPEAAATQNLFSHGYSPSAQSLDRDAILKELDKNPEGAYDSISPDTKKNITDFLQSVPKKGEDSAGTMKYIGKHLVWSGVGGLSGLVTGHGGLEGALAGEAGLVLTDKMLTKWMSDPVISKVAIGMTKGEIPPALSEPLSKKMLGAIRGTSTYLINKEGEKEKVEIGDGGQIQYPAPGSH